MTLFNSFARVNFSALIFVIASSTSLLSTVALANSGEGCTIYGNDNAPVTIVEFADFECPFCVKGSRTVERLISEYPGQWKVVFRNLPLAVHASSMTAAKAFSAAGLIDSSKAYAFQKSLFDHAQELATGGENLILQLAANAGYDQSQLKLEMQSPAVQLEVDSDLKIAKAKNFTGTPSFMIGTQELRGAYPYADFKKMIDNELGKAH